MLTDVKVLLEGIEIPVRSCSVSNSTQTGAKAYIGVIARSSLLNITPFSHVDIYYRYKKKWICVFQGLFVSLSPSSAASNQEYSITAVSQEWQLDRVKLATMALGKNPTDIAWETTTYQTTGARTRFSTDSSFLNYITNNVINAIHKVAPNEINGFPKTFLNTLSNNFTSTELGKLYKKYFLRIGLDGCMSAYAAYAAFHRKSRYGRQGLWVWGGHG